MAVDNFYCTYCLLFVSDNCNCIYCDCCDSWIHSKCLKFSRSYLSELDNSDYPFYCPKCMSNELPFMLLSKKDFRNIINTTKKTGTSCKTLCNTNKCLKLVKSNCHCPTCLSTELPCLLLNKRECNAMFNFFGGK